MFEVTRRYRTIHSIRDDEAEIALRHVPKEARTIVDFGCHLGHLSFELAYRFPATIYAVDNFAGTVGDDLMRGTVERLTEGGMGFLPNMLANMIESERLLGGFRCAITPVRSGVFLSNILPAIEIDYVFIDSSHREEDVHEFDQIAARVRPGGILAGHDFTKSCPGVWNAVNRLTDRFDWIVKGHTFVLRKKSPGALPLEEPQPSVIGSRAE